MIQWLRKRRMSEVIVYGGLTICFLSLLLIAFWSFYPYKTMDVGRVAVVDKVVSQGDNLSFYLEYTRYTDVDTTIYRDFIDGLVFSTATETRESEKGSFRRFVEVPIPSTLPPGKYILRTNVEFHMNPIRDIEQGFDTDSFVVVSKLHDESSESTSPVK
jgi:hypothetical protein